MKLLPLYKAPIFYLVFLILVFAFISCSDDEDGVHEQWTYIGLRHVNVDSVEVPHTLQFTDTLEIYMSGYVMDADRPLFSHVEEVRDLSQVDLILWAEAYAWSGSGPMPPTSLTVNCTHKLIPPFYPDTFTVHVLNPDNSTIKRVVHIID